MNVVPEFARTHRWLSSAGDCWGTAWSKRQRRQLVGETDVRDGRSKNATRSLNAIPVYNGASGDVNEIRNRLLMANQIDFKKLGHTIRFLRQGKGWTLNDLAEKSGLSKAYLSDLENGLAGKPNIQYVFAVAQSFGTTLDRLLQGAAPPVRIPQSHPTADLPPGLAELKSEMNLSDEEVEMLSTVNFRGNRPRDKEAWRYLLETLRLLGQWRSTR